MIAVKIVWIWRKHLELPVGDLLRSRDLEVETGCRPSGKLGRNCFQTADLPAVPMIRNCEPAPALEGFPGTPPGPCPVRNDRVLPSLAALILLQQEGHPHRRNVEASHICLFQ